MFKMSIGFTGTRDGMTEAQKKQVQRFFVRNKFTEAHHGACIGADKDFQDLIEELPIQIHAHPSTIEELTMIVHADVIHMPKPPLERNTDIVEASDVLIVTPKQFKEIVRSGTWATVRRARSKGIRVFIIFPDGTVQDEDKRK